MEDLPYVKKSKEKLEIHFRKFRSDDFTKEEFDNWIKELILRYHNYQIARFSPPKI